MEQSDNSPDPTPNLPVHRYDGWTADRQEEFLTALAACGCVRDACKAVGMSHVSAYRLRAKPSAMAFRRAWDAALDCAMSRLEDAALSRAINGVARPIFYQGELVGEWRHHDERLAMFLLRYRRALRYGSQLDRLPPPPPPVHPPGWDDEPDPDEAMGLLDYHLGELTDYGEPPDSARQLLAGIAKAFPATKSPRALDGGTFGNFAPDCDDRDAPLEPPE